MRSRWSSYPLPYKALLLLLASIVGSVSLFCGCGLITTAATGGFRSIDPTQVITATTPQSTTSSSPHVVLSIQDAGPERTSAFTVQGSSQLLQWSCDNSELNGTYILIHVYTVDGQDMGEVLSDKCEQGNTSGQVTFSLASGQYKLDIQVVVPVRITITDEP